MMRTIQNDCFHTSNVITLRERDAALLPELDTLCRSYSELWNHTRPGSDVWNINHGDGVGVPVAPETIRLLRLCEKYREETDGAFNLLAVTAKHILRDNPDASPVALAALAKRIAQDRILIEDSSVRCPSWARIDFGSIAKGYVCDRLVEVLRDRGVDDAMIDLGGNIFALGNKEDGTPWRIGIRDPFAARDAYLCVLELRDRSAVTSGMYERSLTLRGEPVHHIIDPRTGLPCKSCFSSVTVISASSAEADAYSTAITVMGQERMEAFLQQRLLDVLCVTPERNVFFTNSIHPIFPR